MALVDNFAAGRYGMTYNAVDVGLTKEGAMMDLQSSLQLVNQTDLYGETVIDGFYRGANCFLQFTCLRWMAGSRTPFWPWGALGQVFTSTIVAGVLVSNTASALVMTAQTGSPAATEGPATLTASKSLLAENFNSQLMFDSRLREIPIRLRLYPYTSSTNLVHFTTT